MRQMALADSNDFLMRQVRQALEMASEERILAGVEMFETWCELARAGIRGNFPEADEAEIDNRLDQRLAIARRQDGRVPA